MDYNYTPRPRDYNRGRILVSLEEGRIMLDTLAETIFIIEICLIIKH